VLLTHANAGPRQIDLVADLPGTLKLAARLLEVLDAVGFESSLAGCLTEILRGIMQSADH
jgi:hypothetical protein